MSLNIKRIQLTENGVAQDVDILTSAECVTFEDGVNLQDKYDNGDIASAEVLGDITDVVGALNELGASARENTELISELANRPPLTSALRKEVCDGEWGSVSELLYEFVYGSAVVLNNEIHVLGGSRSGSYTLHIKYNGSSWSSVSTLPYNFYKSSAVVLDNEIHILGTDNGNGSTNHYKFNGTSWESVSTLPYNFSCGSAVVFNGEIHIMGGYYASSSSYYTNHYKYNGTTWESVSTLPYIFYFGSAIVFDNKIHILGSANTTNNNINTVQHYTWSGGSWEYIGYVPYSFIAGSVVLYLGKIHILGGNTSPYTQHYNFNDSTWSSVSTLPYKFYGGSAVVLDNEIHILGTNSSSNYKSHYSLKPQGTYLNGYSKADTEIYLPISTTPITSNLVATDDGYTVTEDGYVEVLLNE
jgi:hypothetical protein